MIQTFHTPEQIRFVADNLRPADVRELTLSQPSKSLYQVVREAVYGSRLAYVLHDSRGPLALWGVQEFNGIGSVWMVATPRLESVPLSFLRLCKPALSLARRLYPQLACAAHRGNTLHLDWLRWLGFTPTDVGHPHFIIYTHV